VLVQFDITEPYLLGYSAETKCYQN